MEDALFHDNLNKFFQIIHCGRHEMKKKGNRHEQSTNYRSTKYGSWGNYYR
jgi:hypothetical protein